MTGVEACGLGVVRASVISVCFNVVFFFVDLLKEDEEEEELFFLDLRADVEVLTKISLSSSRTDFFL